jgi:hypothetical protein
MQYIEKWENKDGITLTGPVMMNIVGLPKTVHFG